MDLAVVGTDLGGAIVIALVFAVVLGVAWVVARVKQAKQEQAKQEQVQFDSKERFKQRQVKAIEEIRTRMKAGK